MRPHLIGICLVLAAPSVYAEQAQPAWPADLSNDRRALLGPALAFLKANPAIPYKLGSAFRQKLHDITHPGTTMVVTSEPIATRGGTSRSVMGRE